MRMRAVALCLTGILLGTAISSPTLVSAQNAPTASTAAGIDSPIGKVTSVAGTVTIRRQSAAVVVQANVSDGDITAKVGELVYRGDTVQTGTNAALGLVFADGTSFNLSQNARMVLNEFVYDPNSTSNSTMFSLSTGSFTFVAGKVAKTGNMVFDTPVATMGIRGTTPRVEISNDGTVKFSTLVEEEGSPTPANRGAQDTLPNAQPAKSDPFKKPINLNICRGC